MLQYLIANDFDMGAGDVRKLQEQLVCKFESLARATNRYDDAEGRAAHYGFEAFQAAMDQAKKSIRAIQDAAVQLMTAIYKQGHEPLPSEKGVDQDVSSILDDSLMTSAAQSATATDTSKDAAETSKAARPGD